MIIECNEIVQTTNQLITAFADCNKIKNSDLRKLVELISAVNTCSNGGPNYDTLITDVYEPVTNTVITYPINTFHAITMILITGNVIYNGVTLPQGSTINIEFTNLNQTPFTFTAIAGSKVIIEYIIET